MVLAILRDSFFGWCCRFVTGGRVFKYPEEVHTSIWQHYLADDDPYLSTIGVAVTSPIIPALPPKNPRRNSPPGGESKLHTDSFLTEEYPHFRRPRYPPMPPEPLEPASIRLSRRPSEESVRRSEWLNSKPSAATLVPDESYPSNIADAVHLDDFGGQYTHHLSDTLRSVPKAARLSNSRSADTLVSPRRDRETVYPPISPKTSSKKSVRTRSNIESENWQETTGQDRKESAVSVVGHLWVDTKAASTCTMLISRATEYE